jgi:predicted site-specific integrase-resolvase
MQSKIDEILKKYTHKMQAIDNTRSIPILVKELDSIVYDMYRELYGLRDIRHENFSLNTFTDKSKKGHCC